MTDSAIDAHPALRKDDASDSGSVTYAPIAGEPLDLEGGAFVRLEEGGEEEIHLKHRFLQSVGPLAQLCSVSGVRRIAHRSSSTGSARIEAYKLYLKAVGEKNGGDANEKLGWYGASADCVRGIANRGFDLGEMQHAGWPFGFGLRIYGVHAAADCVLSSGPDLNGLRHLVLCRVILGRTEEVPSGGKQHGPSSDEFDSGVDDRRAPRKYIVWFPDVNTRVLPLYVLTVKLDFSFSSRGNPKQSLGKPSSPSISFSLLISALSGSLSSYDMRLIKKSHIDYMERKISRVQMVDRLRRIAGDELLISFIRALQNKQLTAAVSASLKNTGAK